MSASSIVAALRSRVQMQQHLGVAGRPEDGSLADEFVAQLLRVDEVAVVADGDLAVRAVDQEGLRVLELALSGGRVADVPDRRRPEQPGEGPLVERVRDVAHLARGAEPLAVARDDAGALLPAVLEGVQPEIGEVGRLGMVVDAEDAALVAELVHLFVCAIRYAARSLKYFSSPLVQICSASATAMSSAC